MAVECLARKSLSTTKIGSDDLLYRNLVEIPTQSTRSVATQDLDNRRAVRKIGNKNNTNPKAPLKTKNLENLNLTFEEIKSFCLHLRMPPLCLKIA